MIASNAVKFTVTAEPLPWGWLDEDVGPVTLEQGGSQGTGGSRLSGITTYSNQTFVVNASGVQLYADSDSLHFVYQRLSGDGSIVARVASLQTGAMAGVMMRETLKPGSTTSQAVEYMPGGSYTGFDVRTTTGGSTTEPGTLSGTAIPYWVKVTRSGNTFTGFASADGMNWTQLTNQTISMVQDIYVGLVAASGSNTNSATATF
jgi:regulation of enolase protein 1 (concanavalin A-like superfamily)